MTAPVVRRLAELHQTSVRRPADFDAYWKGLMDQVAQLPLDLEMTPLPLRSTPEVEAFEIHYTSLDGMRIAGWYCRPRESFLEGPYPGLLFVPGYISEPTLPKSWAKLGYATIGVAPRGKLRSNGRFNPGYPGLLVDNIVDRNTYAYRGFYIDAARAVDVLQALPEVDASRIGVHGSSQGGALTVTTAALRPDAITCGAAGAPYLCGFLDSAGFTHSHPYEEINEYLRQYPDREPQMRAALEYYDGLNFAPMITCPMHIYVGLNDDVCPPETGYDLQKALVNSREVTLNAYPRCAHDAGAYWEMPNIEAFLAKHLRPAGVGRPETTVG